MRKQRLNVLLVEDSADDAHLLSLAVKKSSAPIELSVVTDGEEAKRFLRRKGFYSGSTTPDLVLLDLNLPKKRGLEVLTELKQDVQLQTIPVIVFTTSTSPADILNCYALGAAGYLVKPDNFNVLIQTMQKLADFWALNEFPSAPVLCPL